MVIKSLEIIRTNIPLKKGYKLSQLYEVLQTTEPVIVKIHTDEGVTGVGETDPMPHFTEETAETILGVIKRYLGPAICGLDPLDIAAVHERMDGCIKGNSLAKAAIDMACYDILGKVAGMPVYALLGGKLRNEISMMWSLGDDDPSANAKEACSFVQAGYGTLMIKVGNANVRRDAERVKEIRRSVGKDVFLIVDANQGWNAETAIRFAGMIEEYDIAFFEQPLPYWDIGGMARVRKSISMPLSADESLFTIHEAVQIIKYEAADVFSIKVAKNGGIYKAKRIMDLAAAYNIRCLMNSLIEEGITQASSLHLGVSAPNLHECGHAYFSPLRLDDDISDYHTQIGRGAVRPNGRPGLGVSIDDAKLGKYEVCRFTVESGR